MGYLYFTVKNSMEVNENNWILMKFSLSKNESDEGE